MTITYEEACQKVAEAPIGVEICSLCKEKIVDVKWVLHNGEYKHKDCFMLRG